MNDDNNSFESNLTNGSSDQSPLKKNKSTLPGFIWNISALSSKDGVNIPRFLTNLGIFSDYTINQLNDLSNQFYVRTFDEGEIIFNNGDLGLGFYIIVSGSVRLIIGSSDDEEISNSEIMLEKADYFGELSLLQERSERNATAIANEKTLMLGLFRPDLDALIQTQPHMAAKFIQTISGIIANRFLNLSRDYYRLKKQTLDK